MPLRGDKGTVATPPDHDGVHQTPRFSSFTAGTLRFLKGIQPVNEPRGDGER
jgi:hypothetical protein